MRYLYFVLLIFITGMSSGQDLIYTISALNGNETSPLDSILVENVSNKTSILFSDLPPRKDYIINLTQKAFQGTTSSGLTSESRFRILQNQPGMATIALGNDVSGNGSIAVYNLLGQKVMEANNLSFFPNQLLSLKVGIPGQFLVKVFYKGKTSSFKVMGASSGGSITLQQQSGNSGEVFLKKGIASGLADFQFLTGDSLRISVYRRSFYAYPKSFRITQSAEIQYVLITNSADVSGISNAYVSLEGKFKLDSFNLADGLAILTPERNGVALKYGDIFVAENDTAGYLRKVISVNSNNGKFMLQTIPAGLQEVFVNKELKMSTVWMDPLTPVSSQSSLDALSRAFTDAGGVVHPVLIVYDLGNGIRQVVSPLHSPGTDKPLFPTIQGNKENLSIQVNPNDKFRISMSNGNLQLSEEGDLSFRFVGKGRIDEVTKSSLGELGWGRVTVNGQGKIKSDLSFSIAEAVGLNLPPQQVMTVRKVSIKFLIDGIPVWVDFRIELNQQLELRTQGTLNGTWKIDQSCSFNQGWEYYGEKSQFTPLFNGSMEYPKLPVALSGNSDAYARLSIFPSTAIQIYGRPLFSARQIPFTVIDHSARLQQVSATTGLRSFTAWNSIIEEGGELQTTGNLECAGLDGADFDSGKLELVKSVRWRAPVKLTTQFVNPGKVHFSSALDLVFRVSDNAGLPVPGCTVFIRGEGTFRDELMISNASGETTFQWTVGSKPGFNDFTTQIFNAAGDIISVVRDSVEVYDKDAYGTVTVDGKDYKTKKFGTAVWMVENLAYLPSVTPPKPGSNTEAYYYVKGYYGNNVAEAKQAPGYALYGVMYNWKAATKGETPAPGGTIRGICPQGWHIPGDQDWATLWAYLVDNGYGFGGSGNRIAKAMAAKSGWNASSYSGTPGNNPASNNSSEFNAVPGGFRCTDALDFVQQGMFASWWQAVPRDETNGYHWGFNYDTSQLIKYYSPRGRGYFVRCVKD
ncbi:MAG TPA: FISUMP domain-containing protein [Prolixibacteraceae bacterium]|nr:FISUMP domain-containing protein [Prolixibacteraceae bacterium]